MVAMENQEMLPHGLEMEKENEKKWLVGFGHLMNHEANAFHFSLLLLLDVSQTLDSHASSLPTLSYNVSKLDLTVSTTVQCSC